MSPDGFQIDFSGGISHKVRLSVTTSCPMQLHYFPFDLQHCRVSLQSYSFPTSAVQYSWAQPGKLQFQGEKLSENVMPNLILTDYSMETSTVRDSGEEKSQLDLVLHFSEFRGF